MEMILATYTEKGMSYEEYRELVQKLVEQEKTTGEEQSDMRVRFTKLNAQRMKRIDKQVKLTSEILTVLSQIERPMKWIVLTEAWCGDAAQILPVLQAIVHESDLLEMSLVLRDEYPELMEQFLTNGTKSIPKVIALDAHSGALVGSWGPRPAHAQQMVEDYKQNKEVPYEEFAKNLQLWYTKDKAMHIQEELAKVIKEWGKIV